MRWLWILIVAAICGISVVGCSQQTATDLSEAQIKTIGQAYLNAHNPEWKSEYSLPSKVIDRGGYWEYTFVLPRDTIGGTPVVYIDKQTQQVTKVFHEQ